MPFQSLIFESHRIDIQLALREGLVHLLIKRAQEHVRAKQPRLGVIGSNQIGTLARGLYRLHHARCQPGRCALVKVLRADSTPHRPRTPRPPGTKVREEKKSFCWVEGGRATAPKQRNACPTRAWCAPWTAGRLPRPARRAPRARHNEGIRSHLGPSPLIQGVEALVFGAIEGEELVEADSFLELHWVTRHGIPYLHQ